MKSIRCILLILFGSLAYSEPIPATGQVEFGLSDHPDQSALTLELKLIDSAKESIYLMAYSFSSKDIEAHLEAALARGVKVFALLDESMVKAKSSQARSLKAHGAVVWIEPNSRFPEFHHKMQIIDRKSVGSGSFNSSANASFRNAEDYIVHWDFPAMAAFFLTEFEKLRQYGKPFN